MTQKHAMFPQQRVPPCPACGKSMVFDEGFQTPDGWAERFTCEDCEREHYRNYGRGSV